MSLVVMDVCVKTMAGCFFISPVMAGIKSNNDQEGKIWKDVPECLLESSKLLMSINCYQYSGNNLHYHVMAIIFNLWNYEILLETFAN